MLRGSCLCGRVKYEAEGPLSQVARCHCVQCRKASGSEFACNGSVAAASFRIVEGEALLKHYEWSPGEQRVFCSNCGSQLFRRNSARPDIRLRLGCLDVDVDIEPRAHIFVEEKPSWSQINDALPQFARAPIK